MKDYTKFLKWAVVSFISRDTQDDHKDKLKVAGLFENPITPEDFFIPNLPNQHIKRYIVHIDDLESLELFYNLLNDRGLKASDCWTIDFEEFTKEQKEKFINILSK